MPIPQEVINKISEYEKKYSSSQILDSLASSGKYPDISSKIEQYRKQYGDDEVLSSLKSAPIKEISTENQPNYVPGPYPSEQTQPSQLEQAGETVKNLGQGIPVAETAANLLTSSYGIPISGLAGVAKLPSAMLSKYLGFTEKDPFTSAAETIQDVQGKLIYQPQTKGGQQLTEAIAYPMEKLNQFGTKVGGKLETAGYPNTGAAVHSAIVGAPALIPVMRKGAGKLVESTMDIIKPQTSADLALKQVLQGKTKDFAKGKEAISAINTEGIKTYSDLNQRINDRIKSYSDLVDGELNKDYRIYNLSDLVTKTKTSKGEVVIQNHVADALSNLKEMYEKINDPVKAKEIEQTLIKADQIGLTRKDVNDIARIYGNEFGEKAFSQKSGEPLTSVNARAYENTRKGLKEIAREGMGPEAKELDSTLSSMINTRRLVEKNIEAVNSLRQRVDPRSLGENIGRAVGYALDWASGGTIKGLVGKFLPRGVGNKMLNALDLEEKLSRNLEILKKVDDQITKKTNISDNSFIGENFNPTEKESLLMIHEGPLRMPQKAQSTLEAESRSKIGNPLIMPSNEIIKSPKPFTQKELEEFIKKNRGK